ncbi:MAG: hypothetical protein LBS62_06775 [Clostridiales bacterium]|jgi:hypothetical protein|nr:hypothetical protein [Clostridiales bacterium]
MSYNSKKNISSIAAGILIIAAYAVYAFGERAPAPDDLKSWATAMLVFIGIGVAAVIVIQIIFHIVLAVGIAAKEQDCNGKEVERIISSSMVEDEREKLITLKSAHVGYICAGIGFIAALVALACGWSAVAALHILFGTSAVGSVAEGISRRVLF